MRPGCPRPDKQAFATEGGASTLLHQMERRGVTGNEVYQCVCSKWHVGRPTINDRIRRAIRREQ